MIIYKIELAEKTVEFIEGMPFGYGKGQLLGFGFDNEVDEGECAYLLGKALGLEVYAVFDRDVEILKDFEIELLYNAFIGERFYNITKYEAVKVGEKFVPLKEIDKFTGFYINSPNDLDFVLRAISRIGNDDGLDFILKAISGEIGVVLNTDKVILVSPNVEIEKFAKELGIKTILKTQEIELFV